LQGKTDNEIRRLLQRYVARQKRCDGLILDPDHLYRTAPSTMEER
jgi:hypothetical protein